MDAEATSRINKHQELKKKKEENLTEDEKKQLLTEEKEGLLNSVKDMAHETNRTLNPE